VSDAGDDDRPRVRRVALQVEGRRDAVGDVELAGHGQDGATEVGDGAGQPEMRSEGSVRGKKGRAL